MPLRARVPLGCSYAKFDERGFSGSNELGLGREITFLVEKEKGGERKKSSLQGDRSESVECRIYIPNNNNEQ